MSLADSGGFFSILQAVDVPEFFKLVELPDLRQHDMNDDVSQIDEYPFPAVRTLGA